MIKKNGILSTFVEEIKEKKKILSEDESEGLTEVGRYGPGYKQSVVDKFYKSKGLDPRHLKRYAKSAKTRSGEFRKWKRDMGLGEDIGDKEEHKKLTPVERFLRSKGLDINFITPEKRASLVRSGEFKKWKEQNGIFDEDISTQVKSPPKKDVESQPKEEPEKNSSNDNNKINQKQNDQLKNKKKSDSSPTESNLNKIKKAYRKNVPVGNAAPPKIKEELEDDPKGTMSKVFEKKKQLSKSARIIKSIYKHHRVNEDTYDWEKDDKDTKSLKNPKEKDNSENTKDKKIKAAIVISGGKTLTGQPRDTLEVDPVMKNRPGQTPGAKQEEPTSNK